MNPIKRLLSYCIDILFPKEARILNLEALSPAELYLYVSRPRAIHEDLDIAALFDYQNDLMRELIWQLKYKGNRKIAGLFARCLYEELLEEVAEFGVLAHIEKPLLIPLPISKNRRKERGFNQCELVLEELGKLDTGNMFDISFSLLEKFRDTVQQTASKTRKERIENLKDCFRIADPSLLTNRIVFLLDDVTTTGTTLTQARKILLAASAKKVVCIALAH